MRMSRMLIHTHSRCACTRGQAPGARSLSGACARRSRGGAGSRATVVSIAFGLVRHARRAAHLDMRQLVKEVARAALRGGRLAVLARDQLCKEEQTCRARARVAATFNGGVERFSRWTRARRSHRSARGRCSRHNSRARSRRRTWRPRRATRTHTRTRRVHNRLLELSRVGLAMALSRTSSSVSCVMDARTTLSSRALASVCSRARSSSSSRHSSMVGSSSMGGRTTAARTAAVEAFCSARAAFRAPQT